MSSQRVQVGSSIAIYDDDLSDILVHVCAGPCMDLKLLHYSSVKKGMNFVNLADSCCDNSAKAAAPRYWTKCSSTNTAQELQGHRQLLSPPPAVAPASLL